MLFNTKPVGITDVMEPCGVISGLGDYRLLDEKPIRFKI